MSEAREQILTTAGALFAERGYELVGINEIIAKAGVAKATFYAHFSSKEKLCKAWLEGEASRSEQNNERIRQSRESLCRKVALKFEQLGQYVEHTHFRGCPFSISASMIDPASEVRSFIRDYKESSRQFWVDICQQVAPEEPERARAVGESLFLLYAGATAEAQNAQASWPVEAASRMAVELCESLALAKSKT